MLTIVVPCFNEETRIEISQFRRLLSLAPEARLLFVDDGSTDRTLHVLGDFAASEPDRVRVMSLPANAGKGEAIRCGFLAATTEGPSWTAYIDADLATPIEEVQRLWSVCQENSSLEIVFGSRIHLCGSGIERRMGRHITGRIFAFLAAQTLGTYVYDTQAGVKFFRNTPALSQALSTPFCDRWSFDVELLGRLGRLGAFPQHALEVPLRSWRDVPGSKVSLRQGLKSLFSLWRVHRNLREFHV
jgi:glycosyltransferase involved in cell wall biosynthesis